MNPAKISTMQPTISPTANNDDKKVGDEKDKKDNDDNKIVIQGV